MQRSRNISLEVGKDTSDWPDLQHHRDLEADSHLWFCDLDHGLDHNESKPFLLKIITQDKVWSEMQLCPSKDYHMQQKVGFEMLT